MIDLTRQLYEVAPSQPIGLQEVGSTGIIVWTEVLGYTDVPLPTPHQEPIYGKSYADEIVAPTVTPFAQAARIIDQIINGTIPAQQVRVAIEVVVALVSEPPAYEIKYDGTTFVVTVPPPVDYIESHNWAGWPVYPVV